MRQIVLDTETTGLDLSLGHRVIEIGCVELQNRRHTGRTFHRYLNPERDIGSIVTFLCSAASGYMTGNTILADGGQGYIQ